MVKNILDLKCCSATNLAAVTFGDVKRSPMLNSFIREFKVDPDQAIQELMQQTGNNATTSCTLLSCSTRRSTFGTCTKVYPPPSPTLWARFQR